MMPRMRVNRQAVLVLDHPTGAEVTQGYMLNDLQRCGVKYYITGGRDDADSVRLSHAWQNPDGDAGGGAFSGRFQNRLHVERQLGRRRLDFQLPDLPGAREASRRSNGGGRLPRR